MISTYIFLVLSELSKRKLPYHSLISLIIYMILKSWHLLHRHHHKTPPPPPLPPPLSSDLYHMMQWCIFIRRERGGDQGDQVKVHISLQGLGISEAGAAIERASRIQKSVWGAQSIQNFQHQQGQQGQRERRREQAV